MKHGCNDIEAKAILALLPASLLIIGVAALGDDFKGQSSSNKVVLYLYADLGKSLFVSQLSIISSSS